MPFRPRLRPIAATLLAAFAAASPIALAQAPAAEPPPKPADPVTVLPAVNVRAASPADYRAKEAETGVLGDLPLLSTPFSVNVISHELIVNQQASFLGDFLKNDPSASIGNVVVSFATLRGFLLGTDGFLVNGMHIGYPLSDGRVAMPAFERVDVLKGASAFLNGLTSSGSLGGAINYVPKAPPDRPVRDVALTYDSKSQFGIQLDAGDRFGADREFGYRFNAGFRDGDGAVDEMAWRQGYASGVLDWRVTRDLIVQGGFYYADNKFENIQPFFVGASNADFTPIVPLPGAPDTSRNIGPSWSRFEQNATLAWVRGDWAFAPDWTASAHYGWGRDDRPNDGTQDTRFGQITSGAGDTLLFASEERSRTDVQSAQAQVNGRFATGPVAHNLTLGGSWYEQKGYSAFQIVGFLPGTLNGGTDVPQPDFVPLDGMPYTGKTTATGFFVSDILALTDRWSVLVGGRQAKVTAYDETNTPIPGGEVSKFTPAGSIMFKPTPGSLVYFTYAEGLEPGGTAPVDAANANEVMKPLVTEQYELGAKLETDGLTITAAVFDMQKPLQFRDADNNWVESGEQRHRGVELLATGQLTELVKIVGGVMFLDAKQRGTGSSATDGKRVPGVPEWTANLYADLRVPAVPGLFLNAGAYFNGHQYFDVANQQRLPSWTRFDVGARYETRLGAYPTTFLVAVENVADRSYWASALGSALTLGDPLTVKATARFSF